jgi:hypothetical protein
MVRFEWKITIESQMPYGEPEVFMSETNETCAIGETRKDEISNPSRLYRLSRTSRAT